MLIVVTVLCAAVVLGLSAVAASCILGWANRAFHVPVDPKVEALQDALPGANCGGCGYVGCSEYAQAVADGGVDLTLCAPGGPACAEKLAQIMGVEVSESLPYRAVVHCDARRDQKLPDPKPEYVGEWTCQAANLVAGVQRCIYGCLGFGDCTVACQYDAIHLVDGRTVVDYVQCIGCKACAKACPRNIISMVPFKSERMVVVGCSNQDAGPAVKAACTVGCIGCKACTRHSELMNMDGNLPMVDYDGYDSEEAFAKALEKCPMQRLTFVGKPSEADLAAVAGEELPDQITADFKTTVDDTEWRG